MSVDSNNVVNHSAVDLVLSPSLFHPIFGFPPLVGTNYVCSFGFVILRFCGKVSNLVMGQGYHPRPNKRIAPCKCDALRIRVFELFAIPLWGV